MGFNAAFKGLRNCATPDGALDVCDIFNMQRLYGSAFLATDVTNIAK